LTYKNFIVILIIVIWYFKLSASV